MIRYALDCPQGHGFEGWFGSSSDFDTQSAAGLVSCPHCGSSKISKALMAPAVSTARRREARQEMVSAQVAAIPSAQIDPRKQELIAQMRAIREELLSTSENVGERFTEEARKIHYGESEARGIHGEASLHEAAELIDEGIMVLPVPQLPEDRS